jgi:hypothetical protein
MIMRETIRPYIEKIQSSLGVPITENREEIKLTQNWVEFVVRRSALSLYGYFYFF